MHEFLSLLARAIINVEEHGINLGHHGPAPVTKRSGYGFAGMGCEVGKWQL
jgi:hypothetical protein